MRNVQNSPAPSVASTDWSQYGYKPLWERFPHLFPNGEQSYNDLISGKGNAAKPKQPGALSAIAPIAGTIAGGAAIRTIPSLFGSGSGAAGAATSAAAPTAAEAGVAAGQSAATNAGIGATSTASYLLPAAAAAAVGYSGYKTWQDSKNKTPGQATRGSFKSPYSMVLNAAMPGAGTVLPGLMSMWNSGKSPEQRRRDQIRSQYQQMGLADQNYQINGFDIGKDGGFRLDNGKRSFEVAPDKFSEAARLNALGYLASNGDDKYQNQATGMAFNALTGGGKETLTDDKLRSAYNQAGGYQTVFDRLNQMGGAGTISQDERTAAQAELNRLFQSPSPAPPQQRGIVRGNMPQMSDSMRKRAK